MDASPPPGGPITESRVRPWWVLAAVCSSLLVIGLNTTAINTAVGVIATDLDMSTGQVAWAVNAYMLAAAATVAAGGQFGDVFGRRRMFAIGLVVFAAGSALIAVAPGTGVLIVGRVLQGSGSGMLLPAQLALLRVVFPAERQGTAVGIWAATASFTFAVGPLYGGLFADTLGWRWMFASDLVLLSVSGALGVLFVRSVREPAGRGGPDLPGAAALATATVALVVAVRQGPAWGWTSVATLSALALGLVGAGAFVVAERRSSHPLAHFSLFRSGSYTAGVVTTFAQGFGLLGMLYLVAILLESAAVFDADALDAGLALVPAGLVMFFGALGGGLLADRIGYVVPNTVAMALTAAGAGLLCVVGPGMSVTAVGLLACPLALGVGIAFSTTSASGMVAVPPEMAGEAGGVINMSRYLGAVLVVSIGALLSATVAGARLDDSLASLGVAAPDQIDLDRAMTQSAADLDRTIDAAAGSAPHSEVLAAVQDATIEGFRVALVPIIVVATLAAVAAAVLPRRDHRGSDQEGPSPAAAATS